jgi:hypothetical protein
MQRVPEERGSFRRNPYQPKSTTTTLTWQFAKLYCPCDHPDHLNGCRNEIMVGWEKCKECSKGHR